MRNQGDRGNRHLDVRTIAKAGGELLVFQTKHYDELSQHGIEDAPVAENDQVGRTSEMNEPRNGRKRGFALAVVLAYRPPANEYQYSKNPFICDVVKCSTLW